MSNCTKKIDITSSTSSTTRKTITTTTTEIPCATCSPAKSSASVGTMTARPVTPLTTPTRPADSTPSISATPNKPCVAAKVPSMMSQKSKKSKKASRDSCKSAKSMKSAKKQAPPTFGQSGMMMKTDNPKTLSNSATPNKPCVAAKAPSTMSEKSKKSKKSSGESCKSTKSVKKQAPPTFGLSGMAKKSDKPKGYTVNRFRCSPEKFENSEKPKHCVYDVTQLPPAQRRFPTNSSARRARSMSASRKRSQSAQRRPAAPKKNGQSAQRRPNMVEPSLAAPADVVQIAPNVNNIVILGKTADGKSTIQMTIQMQIIAGEALSGTDQPMEVIPQKIILGGKQFSVDGVDSASKQK